jgi:hypothetical protein
MDERKKRRIGLYVFWAGYVMLMSGYYALFLLGKLPEHKSVLEILAPALIVGAFPVFWISIQLGTFDDPATPEELAK